MARQFIVDDSEWDEVQIINGYAVFMGYLMRGVKGLGILILTWTTVVLLGGFVSILGKKDFWCLTGITLVQTAGVFSIILEETMIDLVRSGWGLMGTAAAMASKAFKDDFFWLVVLVSFMSGIQALVLVIILCPVAILYVLGIYISAAVGLWRLIQHDFDNNAQGVGTHLKPALEVLYSLAVAQGVLYIYKNIHAVGAKVRLAEFVASEDFLAMDKDLVSAYLKDTVEGCEKDRSFASGRNLVTYAVDLMMEGKSSEEYINGVKILGAVIDDEPDRMMLAKHLLNRPSSSFNHMTIQKMIEMMGPRSPYNVWIRRQAAEILSVVASSIHMEEHPGQWINYISSVLDTVKYYNWKPENYEQDSCLPEDYERGWLLAEYETSYWHSKAKKNNSKKKKAKKTEESGSKNSFQECGLLVMKGFTILQNLAIHEDNCRVIINSKALLLRIMDSLNSEFIVNHHVPQHCFATEVYKLVKQLLAIPGETSNKIKGEISRSNKSIVTTMQSILECPGCFIRKKIATVDFALRLSVDTSAIEAGGSSSRIFTWMLQLISHLPDDVDYKFSNRTNISRYSSILAREKMLSWNRELLLQQSVGQFFGDLIAACMSPGDILANRVHAAKILDFLVFRYRKNDEFLKELRKAIVPVMPKVLKEMFGRGSTGEAETKAATNTQTSLPNSDLEKGVASGEGEGCEQASSSQQQTGDDETKNIRRLRKELTEVCDSVKRRWYKRDPDVRRQLDVISKEACSEEGKPVKTFGKLVEEEMKKYQ